MFARRTVVVVTAGLALVACSKKDAATDTSAAMSPDTTSAATAPAPAPTPAAPALTDANIAYILDKANALDSSAGSIAATKGTSADVKEFGRMMMADHHALRKAGEDLVKKLNVTPTAPADDQSAAQQQATMDKLNGAAKGATFDTTYINNEVTYHEAVLKTANDALAAAQNQELKDLITKAAPNIQGHLDKAKAIQAKMAPKS